MRAKMRSKIEIEGKLLAASFAFIRLFAGMHKHVPLQLGVVQKAFLTIRYRANVLSFSMCHHVLTQGTVIGKIFVAVRLLAGIKAGA